MEKEGEAPPPLVCYGTTYVRACCVVDHRTALVLCSRYMHSYIRHSRNWTCDTAYVLQVAVNVLWVSASVLQMNSIVRCSRWGHSHFCEVESTKLRKSNLRSFALSPSQLINILASSFYLIAEIVTINNGYMYLWTGPALPSPFSLKICLCYVMFLKVWLCSFKKCKECVYS